MEINIKGMTTLELQRVGRLLVKASELGYDLEGYGQLAMNETSGNVYLWLEDQISCMYIDMRGGLGYMRTCGNCGEEKTVSEKKRNDEMFCSECGKEMY